MAVHRPASTFAVKLRRNQTDVERDLWRALRNRQLVGAKFRRQVPVGPYVVDFLCVDAMLIIELDGGQHGGADDQVRQRWLEHQGYRLLRFWNNDLTTSFEGVLTTIAAWVK